MVKIGFMLNETEARGILDLVNEKMAGIFCQPVKKIHFVFLSHITARGKGEVVLGQCVRLDGYDEVQICMRPGWQKTAIHELVHSYNPDESEKHIREITNDVCKYLKMIAQQK